MAMVFIRPVMTGLALAVTMSGAALPAGTQQPAPTWQQGPAEADREDLVPRSVAVLRALDKVTARITTLELAVGDTVRFGTLDIQLLYCRSRPPIEPPESFAFLEIEDVGLRSGVPPQTMFEGWMVASSPALNPLEHPVYDVWLIDCKTRAPGASSGSR